METHVERVSNIKCKLANVSNKKLLSKYYGISCNKNIIDVDLLKLELILLENICTLGLNEKEINKIVIGNYKSLII